MRVVFFVLLIVLLASHVPGPLVSDVETKTTISPPFEEVNSSTIAKLLYKQMDLAGRLQFEAFEQALQGYEKLNPDNKDILTVIDYSLPSTEKRMLVLDMDKREVLFQTIVSHGRASGEKYAKSFSNRHESHQSSLGFFITQNTYNGSNGYSLILDGLEKGINDQAKARAIVIHGADYASESIIESTGRLGRSYGCPALPRRVNRAIINTIKDGSLVYIYAKNKEYMMTTKLVKANTNTLLAKQDLDDPERNL